MIDAVDPPYHELAPCDTFPLSLLLDERFTRWKPPPEPITYKQWLALHRIILKLTGSVDLWSQWWD